MKKNKSTQTQNFEYLRKPTPIKNQEWPIGTIPLVSISCTAYNQKDYISQCIESFLTQETTFPVEIIIHDDASTDGTSEIIKEYSLLYPHLFKIILQKENQFNQGVNFNNFNFQIARGRFVALCHGDDYWIDILKLEKQVTAMQNFDVQICGHPARTIDIKDNYLDKDVGFKVKKATLITAKNLIKNNGNVIPFGSIMITSEAKDNMIKYMPPILFHSGFQMLGALKEGVLVLPNPMSVYRVNVPGSTTELMLGDVDKQFESTIKRIHSIKTLKKLYGPRYYIDFNKFLARQIQFTLNKDSHKYKPLLLKEIMKDESLATRTLLHSLAYKYELRYKLTKLIKT